jgi:MFS family permease
MDNNLPSTAENPAVAEAPQQAPPSTNRSALFIVFLVVFIDLLGFGIVLPLLPVIGDRFVSQLIEGGKDNALGGTVVGLLMASFSLMQFLAAPIWGRVSDRIGRRPILLLGLAGSVVFYSLFGYACTLGEAEHAVTALVLMFVARIGAGLAGATIATAQAVIADCTPPEKRKHGMALIGAAFGIGFAFGPLIGALNMTIFPNQYEAIGYSAAVLSLLSLVLGILLLRETRHFGEAPPMTRKLLSWVALQTALRNSSIGPVILTFFLASFGFAAFETTLALFFQNTLGLKPERSYLFFAYIGVILLVTQGFIYRRLAKRLSESTFMMLGILFMALGLAELGAVTIIAQAESTPSTLTMVLVFVGLACAVVGFAFLTPSAQALISRRTDASRQGEILGVNQSASALARILGPPIGVTLLKLNPLLPYAFGAAVLVVLLPLMPRVRRG